MGSCDNCGGGCLPPDDGMHRQEEKETKNLDWCCSFCGVEKQSSNRIFVIGNIRVCSSCINLHYLIWKSANTEIAELDKECVFCSKNDGDNNPVFIIENFEREEFYVCGECIIRNKTKLDKGELNQSERAMNRIHTPGEVFAALDQYVVGQEKAKKATAVQVYLQELLLYLNEIKDEKEDRLERNNLLFLGPTGCGKTLIGETIEKFLGCPLVIADVNSFSEAGYVGGDIYSIFTTLIEKAKGNIVKAQRGVVILDEIDKIASKPGDGGDVSRKPIQQALLPALQGAVLTVPKGFDQKNSQENVLFDTSELLFIGSGSFAGIEEIIQKRMIGKSMGFGGQVPSKQELEGKNFLQYVTRDDLRNFGLIPEFLGRFHRIVSFEALTIPQYLQIIKETKNSLIWQWTKFFKAMGKSLKFDDEALELIARDAEKTESGARALRGIFFALLEDTVFFAENDDFEVIGYHLTVDSYRQGTLEKIIKKTCSGECGPDCCQITGGECCGGAGHEKIIIKQKVRR